MNDAGDEVFLCRAACSAEVLHIRSQVSPFLQVLDDASDKTLLTEHWEALALQNVDAFFGGATTSIDVYAPISRRLGIVR